MDRFSYAITNSEKHVLALKSYMLNKEIAKSNQLLSAIDNIFSEDKILKLPFQSSTIGLINNKCTLIPNKLYQSGDLEIYLKNQIPSLDHLQIFVDDLESISAKIVYAFDEKIYSFLKNHQPKANFYHNSTSVLQGVFSKERGEGEKVYLNVKEDHLQIALVSKNELAFFNAYAYENEKDFIYHVLLVFNQFNLSKEKTPIYISGQITEDSKLYRMIYRYINQVSFIETPSAISLGENSKKTPSHFYFDLLSLQLCES